MDWDSFFLETTLNYFTFYSNFKKAFNGSFNNFFVLIYFLEEYFNIL